MWYLKYINIKRNIKYHTTVKIIYKNVMCFSLLVNT